MQNRSCSSFLHKLELTASSLNEPLIALHRHCASHLGLHIRYAVKGNPHRRGVFGGV